MKRALTTPLFALLLALPGCDFFGGPPDPAEDGLLSCGEDQPLDALTSADALLIDAPAGTGLRIVTAFGDDALAAVLRIDGDDIADHIGEFWDPSTAETVLTGSLDAGQRGQIELFAPGGGAMSGSLRMTCSEPEICWNLADDDGDGRLDCADPLCARVPDCVAAQEPLETETPACSAGFEPLQPPVLRAIDDQTTLYVTSPLGAGTEPSLSFWGGAELLIPSLPATATEATMQVGGAGMLCVGLPGPVAVSCERVVELAAGDEVTFGPDEVAWFEPSAASWESLMIRVDCTP